MHKSIFRYLITGIVLFLIDLSVFFTCNKFGISITFSQVIARSVGATVGFGAHKYFSFKNYDTSSIAIQGTGYVALTIFNIFASSGVVVGLNYALAQHLLVIKILAEIIMITETYLVLQMLFRNTKVNQEEVS